MKVLQLLSNPSIGGTETFLLNLVPRLRVRGIDARLANLWSGGGEIRSLAIQRRIPFVAFESGTRRIRLNGLYGLWRYCASREN